jgi:putative zincin peptidase
MPLELIDRFNPKLRQKQQAAIDAGYLHKLDELELLEDQQQVRSLVVLSLLLLVVGGIFFVVLNIAAYIAQSHIISGSIGALGVISWFIINIVVYILVMLLHEGIHALAFAFWGGKPYFGAKLPVALFCGAKNQVFRRNQYLIVGLAPFVVITVAGILFTLFSPALAAYTLFGTIGNFSGAAGDLWVAMRLWRQLPSVLVEDTETGYRVWEIVPG